MKPPYFSCVEDRLHFKKTCSYDFKRRKNKVTVFRAMERITRERYLPPREVWRVGVSLCSGIAYSYHNILSRAYKPECEVVGMYQGEPILPMYHASYGELVRAIKKAEEVPIHKRLPMHYELFILNFFIKHKITGIAQ